MLRAITLLALVVAACAPRAVSAPATWSLPPEHRMHELGDPVRVAKLEAGCDAKPVGSLEPARAAWCDVLRGTAPGTAVVGANSWVDAFGTKVEHAGMPAGYRVFEAGPPSIYRSVHFAHNGHWMVDVLSAGVPAERYVGGKPDPSEASDFGGALVRPDRTFSAASGRLVVEADASAGIEAYVDAWPEIVVTTAPAPAKVVDPRFTYGVFGGHPAVGCRFEKDRTPVCAAFGPDAALFDLAHDRTPGGTVAGGKPGPAWRMCGVETPDVQCRDRFRIELEPDRLALSVNGAPYMEHRLSAARLPSELFGSDVYVYFASWLYQPTPAVVRFHWGRLAVNP
ncbi:MAG: hypothetical protein HYU87_08705 [Chloroflexi bacterium]|nr:hypothetical protein [Chloroflexota bacterium]